MANNSNVGEKLKKIYNSNNYDASDDNKTGNRYIFTVKCES